MKTRLFDVIWVSAVLVAGLTTGWLIHGGAKLQGPPLPVKSLAQSERRHETRTPTTKTNNKWQIFASQFSTISDEEKMHSKRILRLKIVELQLKPYLHRVVLIDLIVS